MAYVQAGVNGLLIGGVYALVSVGLTLVFGIMNVINFAHAVFLMIGMYVAYYAWALGGIDPLIGSVLAFAVVFVLGALIQRTLITPIIHAPELSQIFLTVGLLITLENAALLLFGSQFRSVRVGYQDQALNIGGVFVSVPYLAAFCIALVCGVALWLFLQSTSPGRAMRATAQNAFAARLMGVDTRRMYSLAYGLGVGLTALGGAVILPYGSVSPTIGNQFVLLMFTAVVLGGLGSVLGALIGGLLVGLIQGYSALFFPIQLQNLVVFIVFITVLALKPSGVLGRGR